MRIAAISDIHGNLPALDAVLADAAGRSVDLIVNLGILSGPLFPVETADRLIPLDLPTIRGNHERQLLELPPERMGASDRYASARLRADQLAWIAALPVSLRPVPDVLMVHGTPACDLEYFLHAVTEDGLADATPAEIEARAKGADAAVILCGHTHLPGIAQLSEGRMIVNPGSVGLPAYADDRPFPHAVESGSPEARYAILTEHAGSWSAELLRVEYAWEAAAQIAEHNRRFDWARALRTGRV
jgi:predicted phosphodiesterase